MTVLFKLLPSGYHETAETYLESCQTSLLDRFCKTLVQLNSFRYCHKNPLSEKFNRVLNTRLH